MGQEFAQGREWSEARSLDWNDLAQTENAGIQKYVKALNHLYQQYSAFYYNDCDEIGFEWIDCSDPQSSIVSFIRRGETEKNQLLFVCNFTPVEKEDFCVGVPCEGSYTEILNSDSEEYGGSNCVNKKPLRAKRLPKNEQDYSITFTLPPLSIVAFRYDYKKPAIIEEKEKKILPKK